MTIPIQAHNGRASISELSQDSASHDDPRVAAALEEYLNRRKAGERLVRDEWLAQHGEISAVLADCLDGLDLILAADSSASEPRRDASVLGGLRPATLLGDFRILREIARGGMGIVYEAEQISLDRRVALKVLPLSSSMDPRWCQRFQVEAQAAAHLRHDHIVPVFAVGNEDGIHYYAMPLIEGRTLSAIIQELRASAGQVVGRSTATGFHEPRNQTTAIAAEAPVGEPSPVPVRPFPVPSSEVDSGPSHVSRHYFRWIAGLGIQAAEALGHAHELGVIHRDVKPSNLMVDHRGELWLTDFGLARIHDDDGLTRTGDLLGTLRYMSPEQAQARRSAVDHRTDIYSLGATLYELTTLRPAFEGRDRQELLNKITLDEPVAPRRFNSAVPRDLETIILKAMAKDLPSRYATAQDLADDLHRFLDDRTILARPPSWIDRSAKWTRRHRVPFAMATVLLIAGLVFGSVVLWIDQQRALSALGRVESAHRREQQNIKTFFSMMDSLTIDAMAKLALTSPTEGSQPDWFYTRALSAYEQVGSVYQDNLEMRLVAAESFRRIGFVRMILRYHHKVKEYLNADVEGAFAKAIALCQAEIAAEPRAIPPRSLLAAIQHDYGDMLLRVRGIDAAQPVYNQAFDTQRKLVLENPGWPAMIADINQRRIAVSQILQACGRPVEAGSLLREVITLDPGRVDICNDLAWLLALDPRADRSRGTEAVALSRKVLEKEPNSTAAWNTLSLALLRSGDLKASQSAIEKTMTLHEADASDFVVQALIQAKSGDKVAARAALKKAATHKADDDPNLVRLSAEVRSLTEDSAKPSR